jgi:DNA invertase Pin-like site-specific DNA recombinase
LGWKLNGTRWPVILTVDAGSLWPNTLRWKAARLDRLARNLHFVSSLQERGVDFVAADMPDANRLTIHIIAAVAEAVGRTISENTKTALAAAKARGVKLGNPNGARALKGKQVGNAEAVAKLKATATQRAGGGNSAAHRSAWRHGSPFRPTYGFQILGTPGFKDQGFAGSPLPS